MSIVLGAVGALVILAGGAGGVWLYNARQRVDDETGKTTAEADQQDAADGVAGDVDRPEPTYSAVGRAAATVLSMIPDPERGARESASELVNRPEPKHSRLGMLAARLISLIPKPLFGVRETLFKRLTVKSLHNYHKVGGGDALGLIAEPGQSLDVRPIKYRAPKECDETEKPGWVEKGGEKVWHAGAEGRVVDYIGKTPIVALERDSHVEAGWLKPRIGQAIELDNYDPVYVNPQFEPEVVAMPDLDTGATANGNGNALADGGQGIVDIEVTDMGTYGGAEVVDLDSGNGYDGMRIDFRKASAWAFEQTTTEEMQMQQERGRLMGLMGGDGGPSVVKIMLIAAAIILGTLFAVFGLPQLLGGSGVSAGGINPLLIGGL
jgi:hypothetical protein